MKATTTPSSAGPTLTPALLSVAGRNGTTLAAWLVLLGGLANTAHFVMARVANDLREDGSVAVSSAANVLPAPTRDVRPCGTTDRRISGRDYEPCDGRGRSSLDDRSKKIRAPAACDGPRAGPLPHYAAVVGNVRGSDATARDGTDARARSADIGRKLASVTNAALRHDIQGCSNEIADAVDEKDAHIP